MYYIGHNYSGRVVVLYIGHNYIGHNYIGRAVVFYNLNSNAESIANPIDIDAFDASSLHTGCRVDKGYDLYSYGLYSVPPY